MPFLQLVVDEHLVLARVVGAGLTGGDADARHDRPPARPSDRARRSAFAVGSRLPYAGRRGDDDLAGLGVDGDDRPGGKRRRPGEQEHQRSEYEFSHQREGFSVEVATKDPADRRGSPFLPFCLRRATIGLRACLSPRCLSRIDANKRDETHGRVLILEPDAAQRTRSPAAGRDPSLRSG